MSSMYYRFEQTGRDIFVEFMRRAFRYGGDWQNRDLKIISLSGSISDLVYEQFFEEEEHYPIVTVGTAAGQQVAMGFNDQVEDLYDVRFPMGTRSLTLIDFSTSSPIAFRLPSTFSGSLGGVDVDMIWKEGENIEDIDLFLYSDYTTTGSVLLASGSILNFDRLVMGSFFGGFYPYVPINKGTDYWVVLAPKSGSVYRIGVDTTSDLGYISNAPSGSLVSGSLYGGLRYSPVMRMGGAHEFTVSIRSSAKNSMEKAQNLADLTEIYIKLAQHGVLSRLSTNQSKIDLSRLYVNGVPFFTSKGVAIKSVSKTGIENRKRGDNDIIFTVGVNVEIRTEWNVDFDEKTILDIDTQGALSSFL